MTVIDINELRRRKNEKQNKQEKPVNIKKMNPKPLLQEESELTNSSYFFNFMNVTVNFGGAFVRSLLENIEKHKEEISGVFEMSTKLTEENLALFAEQEPELHEKLAASVRHQDVLIQDILHKVKTPQDFDDLFKEGSEYLSVVGFVLTIVMVKSYSQFDYHRMIKNNWLHINEPVEEFINSPVYKEIKDAYTQNEKTGRD